MNYLKKIVYWLFHRLFYKPQPLPKRNRTITFTTTITATFADDGVETDISYAEGIMQQLELAAWDYNIDISYTTPKY